MRERRPPAFRFAFRYTLPHVRILTVTDYQLPHWGGIEMPAAALHERYRRMGHESVWLSSDLPPQAVPAPGCVRVPASDLPNATVGVAYPLWSPRTDTVGFERVAPSAWVVVRSNHTRSGKWRNG